MLDSQLNFWIRQGLSSGVKIKLSTAFKLQPGNKTNGLKILYKIWY